MAKEMPVKPGINASRKMIQLQKYEEACRQLQELLKDDPKDEDALELLGMANFFLKRMEPARDYFERLTQLNPSLTKAWVNLGAILNCLGEHKKSTEVLRRALQKDRKCAEAYYNMGIAQRAMHMNTMAISAYREALKLAPEMVDAHINLGNIYLDMKNVGLALQCFQAALRHHPESRKAKKCLETAQSMQKLNRTEASPFGRLVDIAELASQKEVSHGRQLSQADRLAERDIVQKQTKVARTCAKESISQLETSLPQLLHRIKIAILRKDERLDSSAMLEQLTNSSGELSRSYETLREASSALRKCMHNA
jgi:tetratricopeptide (TPR) repeat protein